MIMLYVSLLILSLGYAVGKLNAAVAALPDILPDRDLPVGELALGIGKPQAIGCVRGGYARRDFPAARFRLTPRHQRAFQLGLAPVWIGTSAVCAEFSPGN